MIYPIYTIRDVKTGFTAPILDQNDDVAIRNFSVQVKNAKVNPTMFFSPEDYSLYKIGEYDTETGSISPLVPNKHLADAVDFINKNGKEE